ncbi:MAG: hypothetical protein E7064_09100 [Spirochaetaceae bacterium]|nr:hypothetical protein [Spirochaetaceae bacterium]
MKHFYFAPRVNLKKSMENILSLFKEKNFSREEVESILFNPYGQKETGNNISNDKFLLWTRESVKMRSVAEHFHTKPPAMRVEDKNL